MSLDANSDAFSLEMLLFPTVPTLKPVNEKLIGLSMGCRVECSGFE